jgi:antirestriction protein ArdC
MNVYETVTANIIAAIENGAGEFRMPWHRATTADGMPSNAATGAEYRGSNVLTLWATAMGKGYASNKWATYKQWAAIGGQVRKGEKSAIGIYYNTLERTDDSGDVSKIPFARPFFVFNAEQVDGYSDATEPVTADQTAVIAAADSAIAATGAKITHSGSRAFYRPSTDDVYMPPREAFTGTDTSNATESYYSTLLHELAHWTGHDSRLSRDFSRSKRFGDESYAGEELIAELGAAFLCARLGITNTPRVDHAQYIASWLKVLKADNRAVIRAASDAQKAADYILAASQPAQMQVAA